MNDQEGLLQRAYAAYNWQDVNSPVPAHEPAHRPPHSEQRHRRQHGQQLGASGGEHQPQRSLNHDAKYSARKAYGDAKGVPCIAAGKPSLVGAERKPSVWQCLAGW